MARRRSERIAVHTQGTADAYGEYHDDGKADMWAELRPASGFGRDRDDIADVTLAAAVLRVAAPRGAAGGVTLTSASDVKSVTWRGRRWTVGAVVDPDGSRRWLDLHLKP